jgi:hypothetical protein
MFVCAAAALALVAGPAGPVRAQGLTGQIGGTVVDSSNAAVPGATVVVRNTNTQVTRETVTDGTGVFVVTNLLAGTYDLRVTLTGFRTYEQRGISLSAQERMALPPIMLEVGGFEETLTVQAEALRVQTQSGERSGTVTAEQMANIQVRGRDFLGTLVVIPGVVSTSTREAPGWSTNLGLNVNGRTSLNLTFDGITTKDTGANGGTYAMPNMDSIAEIRVQTSNFQAEYGRSSGASVNVVTKSGSSQFRGGGAWYQRHEALNANTWSRRRSCADGNVASCEKLPYRYTNVTWNIGGPVVLPNFNEDRDTLFFFFSQEFLPRTVPPNSASRSRLPTLLERAGDFSQTVNSNGQLRNIRNPFAAGTCNVNSGGPACFAGNRIPANLINPIGQAILNLAAQPNIEPNQDNNFANFEFSNVQKTNRRDNVGRVDWNVRPGTTFYSRVQQGYQVSSSHNNQLGVNSNWGISKTEYAIKTFGLVNTLLHTFSASTVLELTFGWNHGFQDVNFIEGTEPNVVRDNVGLSALPIFYPQSNRERYLPDLSMSGGGLNSTMSFDVNSRFPFDARNTLWNWSANLTRVLGSHNLKMGLFIERTARPAPRASEFNGTLNFNQNSNNPLDTNLGFSNVLLGVVNSYSESTNRPFAEGRFNQIESFVQDSWRLRRNLTIDAGVRFVYIGPTFMEGQQGAHFVPDTWNPGDAPLLFTQVCANNVYPCSASQRRARNPLTGDLLSTTFVGRLVPGSGDFYNGMVVFDQTPWEGAFRPSPRVGFAWDITGDGRTAVRGGWGVNYERYSDDTILTTIEQPPIMDTNTATFTTLTDLLAAPLTQTPRGVVYRSPYKAPAVYTWSLGVQRELPFRVIGDVAYVGSAGRSLQRTIQLNNLDYGTRFRPENIDPATGEPKADNFLRPIRGFAGIGQTAWIGYDNFHSIQFSLNQRRARFSWSAAYTGVVSNYSMDAPDPFLTDAENKARNYSNGGRPHNLVLNYSYEVPNLSTAWNNIVARVIGDGWQVSGLTTMQGGTRQGFAFEWEDGSGQPEDNMTGGSGGSRVNVVCDPNLPRSERTFERQFRTECIRPPGGPAAGDPFYLGTSTEDEWVSLGYINHDLTLVRSVPLGGRRTVQLRVEAYNVFNTTQYTLQGDDQDAEFNFTTGEKVNPNFGRVDGVRGNSQRVVQVALRFTF